MANKPKSAEMHAGPGFQIQLDFPRVDAELTRKFSQFETPDISDQLNRLYSVDPAIRCLTDPRHKLCGPVCTVKVFPGDNLMMHKVLDVAKPGDIIVVDAHSSTTNAVLGDIICTKATHRGIAGFVIDGLIRDLPGVLEVGMPVFARGTTPVGPLHRGPGEINYPVALGGVVVNPGDIMVADVAGIVVIPQRIAEDLLERMISHQQANAAYLEAVQRGDFSNAWVDTLLESHDCPIIATTLPRPKAPATSGYLKPETDRAETPATKAG